MVEKYIVRLTNEERTELRGMVTKGKSAAYKIKHANMFLMADADGPAWPDEEIAEAFSVHTDTVANIRQRFVEQSLEAALGRKKQEHPSRPRKFDGASEAKLIAMSYSQPPDGRVRWTLRLLADKAVELAIVDTVSHETIRSVLKKTN